MLAKESASCVLLRAHRRWVTVHCLVAVRAAPELLRMDNGPEMTAHALRDWCEFSKAGTVYIEPVSSD